MFEITSGVVNSAQKVVIYGPEGIGKSTFASQFPDPIFIDTEGSTKRLNVKRLPKPTSWEMLLNEIREASSKKLCKTLIVDTIDWAEQLCVTSVCAAHQKKGIEDFGYGKGYVFEKEEFGRLLNLLQDVVDGGINVVLTAHAQLKKFEQPDELGAYDRWELKLGQKTSSQISPLVKEWADMVLFANYKTYAVSVDDKGKKFKAQGGERIMYTSHHPCWDAKNRDGLPAKMPFDYSGIAHLFENNITAEPVFIEQPTVERDDPKTSTVDNNTAESTQNYDPTPEQWESVLNIPDDLPKALQDLMRANKVSEEEIRSAVAQRGYFPEDMPISDYPADFVNGVLIGAWDSVYQMIKELNINGVPF